MSFVKLHQVNIVLAETQLNIEVHTRVQTGVLIVRREVCNHVACEDAYIFVNQSYFEKWISNDPYYKFIPDAFEDLIKLVKRELFIQKNPMFPKTSHHPFSCDQQSLERR